MPRATNDSCQNSFVGSHVFSGPTMGGCVFRSQITPA
jgi:hypothetical protein